MPESPAHSCATPARPGTMRTGDRAARIRRLALRFRTRRQNDRGRPGTQQGTGPAAAELVLATDRDQAARRLLSLHQPPLWSAESIGFCQPASCEADEALPPLGPDISEASLALERPLW